MTVISRFIPRAAAVLTVAMFLQGCGDSAESLLASAKEYAAKNDHKAAVIQLKNALQKDPKLAEARFLLGRSLLESGDVVSAEKELRRAMELGYPVEQVAPPLARALNGIGQFEKTRTEFAKVTIKAPAAVAELQTALGYAHLAQNDIAGARSAFAAALSADSNHVPARLGEARLVAGAGQLPQALEMVEKALTISPKDAEAWQLKGDILLAQRQSKGALAAFRKALEANPNYLPSHASIVSMLVRESKLEEAGKQLEAMKRLAPKHPQTLYLQAQLAHRQKNLPAAEAAIEQALSVYPDSLPALLMSALIKLELGSYAQSEARALKVLSRVPNQPLARRILASGYLKSAQTAKAIETLKPALEKDAKDPLLLGLAGEAYMMQGDHAQAARLFERASKLDPGNAAVRTALALSHLARGETERALLELEQTAASDSGQRADMALISAHMQRRAFDDALAAIAALEKKLPTAALPHNLRGVALTGKKDVAGARRSFERALALDALYIPAAANLARLDLAEKKPDAARQRFEAILAKDSKNLQALLALAELKAQTGGTSAEVAKLLDNAIAAQPDTAAPRLALIGHYLRVNEPKNAVNAAQAAMTALRENVEIMGAAARAYQAAGEPNQALSLYSRIAALQPTSPVPHVRMAQVQVATNNPADAQRSLREALVIKPDLVEAQAGLIALDLQAGRVEDALAHAREVQKQRPKEAIGHLLEGDVHASRKSWDNAASAYRAGLKLNPSTALAVRLHTALAANGRGADQFAESWLRDHPKDGAFRLHLARASIAGKNYQTAIKQYEKVLETQPNNAAVLNNIAWLAAQMKDPKAMQYAERAYELAPANPAIKDTLGVLLLEKGDTARGLKLLREASAAAPQAADIRLNLARGLITSGLKDEARKELDALAGLGDKFPEQAEVAKLRQQL